MGDVALRCPMEPFSSSAVKTRGAIVAGGESASTRHA